MTKTVTSPYDVAKHLRTPEEMAAYLEACFEEANGDAAFIAKALGDIARAKGMVEENMPNVIVVPETPEFRLDVSHGDLVWINRQLGVPQLEANDARYLAPFWIEEEGVDRVYHIVGVRETDESTEIKLGNSFVLLSRWTNIGQRRRFEYHPLADFGFLEISPGLLMVR